MEVLPVEDRVARLNLREEQWPELGIVMRGGDEPCAGKFDIELWIPRFGPIERVVQIRVHVPEEKIRFERRRRDAKNRGHATTIARR